MNAVRPLIDPELRPMGEADVDSVHAIERACFSTPWSRNTFANLLKRPDADLWVAEAGGQILGYAVVWYMADEAELGNLAVEPNSRRRGLGRRLLERAIESARARKAERIYLEVRTSNEGAQRLYERRGFRVAGLRRRYYRLPVEDARVMCLELSPGEC